MCGKIRSVVMERAHEERDWLENEVRLAASLSDADRIRILRDLLWTVEAIRKTKSQEQLLREEEARRILEDEPAREHYRAWMERFA